MKRIYRQRKSSEIKKQALKQLRETRAYIDEQCPDLLDRFAGLLGAEPKPTTQSQGSVEIDRQKNLETVLRFVELKPHSDHLKQELKKILN